MAQLPIDQLISKLTSDQWTTTLLDVLKSLGLTTTAWQPGGITRTLIAGAARMFAGGDSVAAVITKGGFLNFAVDPTVTPDPSVTPGVAAGWLDLVADSFFNVQRLGATYATNTLIITNTSVNPYGPFSAGQYHVSNPALSKTYSNQSSLTINAGLVVGTSVSGATNATPIEITTSANHGRATGDYVTISGVSGNTAANGTWKITVTAVNKFTLDGSAGNGAYTTGGIVNLAQAATFAADVAGSSSTSAIGTIIATVSSLVGVSVTNLLAFVGGDAESNTKLADRCRLKLGALSPNGPAQAYQYFALSASLLLGTTSDITKEAVALSGGAITRAGVTTSKLTGTVTTTIANASGPVSGISNLAVSGATNATPIEITTATNHGLATGAYVNVSGVRGNTAANGTWKITVTAVNKFTLDGSAGTGAYTTGGVIEGGDLGLVDNLLQLNCVPAATTAVTASAGTTNIAIVCDVWAPTTALTNLASLVTTALTNYIASLPIGGLSDPSGAYTNVLPFDAVLGEIYGASPDIQQVTATLNGGVANVAIPTTNVAVLSPAIVVNLHGT